MALVKHQEFLKDKNDFFSSMPTSFQAIKAKSRQKTNPWLATNVTFIEQEFMDLFASLKAKNDQQEAYGFYCYYCCSLLAQYYQAYDKKDKVREYETYCNVIEKRQDETKDVDHKLSFMGLIEQKLISDLSELASTPFHTTKLKNLVGLVNLTRLQVVFSRLFVRQSLIALADLHILEKLLHPSISIDGAINRLDKVTGTLNALSIGVFAARFLLNAGLVLKHVFIPSANERKLGYLGRFNREMEQRHCTMLNDLVWGTVNALTNYASFFHIPASAANWTVAAFLIFDLSLLFYRRRLAENAYLAKRSQYLAELNDVSLTNEHKAMVKAQLKQLDIRWQATNASYWLNITAALLLMSGFSAALFLNSASALPACFFVTAIAMAVYLSADAYGVCKEKKLLVEEEEKNGKGVTKKSKKALARAQFDFAFSMAKNTLVPMLIMGAYAVSWKAALVMIVACIGFEIGQHCLKQYLAQPNCQPALSPAP